MSVEAQAPDGSVIGQRERDTLEVYRAGGYATPAPTSTSSVGVLPAHQPGHFGGATLHFNIGSDTSSNDSAGGKLLCWQNTKGFDIIVSQGAILDVTTASGAACSASFGKSTNSTGTSSNMIATQSVSVIGVFNGGTVSVRVNQNEFITGSVSAGTSSALRARAYFYYLPAPATGSG